MVSVQRTPRVMKHTEGNVQPNCSFWQLRNLYAMIILTSLFDFQYNISYRIKGGLTDPTASRLCNSNEVSLKPELIWHNQ